MTKKNLRYINVRRYLHRLIILSEKYIFVNLLKIIELSHRKNRANNDVAQNQLIHMNYLTLVKNYGLKLEITTVWVYSNFHLVSLGVLTGIIFSVFKTYG